MVEQYIKDSSHAFFVTLVYEEELLNTGGALLNNRGFFDTDNLMLIHGVYAKSPSPDGSPLN